MTYFINGKPLPKIVLGSWAWGDGMNGSRMVFGTVVERTVLKQTFELAYGEGFNCWDTAAIYGMGSSEQILGEFVSDKDVIISTKYTPGKKYNPEHFDDMLAGSLARMNGKTPDIYWLHNAKNLEKNVIYACKKMKEGKIASLGICNANLEEVILAEKLLNQHGEHLAGVQGHYSLLYRKYEKEGVIQWCKENKIPFFAYMILEQGALTGRFNRKKGFPLFSRRNIAFPKRRLKQIEPLLKTLGEVGANYGLPIAETNIAWALAKGVVPLIGVTKPYQVQSLFKVRSSMLTNAEMEKLEQVAKETGVQVKASWEKN